MNSSEWQGDIGRPGHLNWSAKFSERYFVFIAASRLA
jgi:hypothetical protein